MPKKMPGIEKYFILFKLLPIICVTYSFSSNPGNKINVTKLKKEYLGIACNYLALNTN